MQQSAHDDVELVISSLLDEELVRDDPKFDIRLAPGVWLAVDYTSRLRCNIHGDGLSREKQEALTALLTRLLNEQPAELPLFSLLNDLRAWLVDHPLEADHTGSVEEAAPPCTTTVTLKTVLFWSHHLKSTIKRKDIHAFSSELGLWTIARPGYPGVIVSEGKQEDLDEFIRRIKAMQWKALTVRYDEVHTVALDAWTERVSLAKVIGPKPHAIEVESMSELSAAMDQASLRSVFLSAMKLQQ
ncbi:uncharacterized protein L969DRAFT_64578 [Mixia osmundae IAM 14324]|uniref:Small nuclear ribonucleoprotein Prp3 C-terminal domain-containing protein n=1 Tax=Mixia osmundae (strain CBS 9802 / IAM 14324 / JCM 22182 / KY 12970) TaxID=764103 RepID=G7DSN6_MIXOS|nr:uncharacterized protein L969DRAFT_64578 [Mixia osmundae IAM 14324]KEI37907.1 hypothetical protein L969DRAFT_64578 [Mixia osmundae IAM 14324]GAA93596.1 hypothetical protein E5Q_00240 [Mixia osmundae IAM 14324]